MFPKMIGFIANDRMRVCLSTVVRFKYQNRFYLRHHVETSDVFIERVGMAEAMALFQNLNIKCYSTIVKGIPFHTDEKDTDRTEESTRFINEVITDNDRKGTGLAALSNTPNT